MTSHKSMLDVRNEDALSYVKSLSDNSVDLVLTDPLVLDMFLGSGTTLIAANNLKRACFGCEKDLNYYTQTLERVTKHLENKL